MTSKEQIRTEKFLTSVVEGIRPFAFSNGVTLSLETPVDLPSLFTSRSVATEVLTNLLINAVRRSTHGGSVTVEVSGIEDRGGEQLLKLHVTHTGPLLSPADIDEVLSKLGRVRGSRDTSHCEGNAGRLEIKGGYVTVKPSPGGGFDAVAALPVAKGDTPALEKTA